jgi:hypothetical protein
MRWSQLTILLVTNRALCRHESGKEGSSRGALSHVRREAGRKVRIQHPRTEPHRDRRLAGPGEVNCAVNLQAAAGVEARRSKATPTVATAAALSSGVGGET